MPCGVTESDVWVAKDDGSDLIRATSIVSVGIDYNGNITARIGHSDGMAVTLADSGRQRGEHPAADFHRQLLRIIRQLSDGSGSYLVRPVHDEADGWQWITEPL
jgi:hypothetical protein